MGLSSVIVQWLVDAGAENDGVDIDGRSALHHAVLAGADELMQILLNTKVDINIKDNTGLTAMNIAMQRNNTTAIVYIHDRMSTLDKNGNSTLHLASAIDNVQVIEYILSRMYALDKNGKAGPSLASDTVFAHHIVGTLLVQVPKDVYYKQSKLPVNGLNRKGESALHIATEKRLLPNVSLLLAYGADNYVPNSKTGDTPMHYAVAGYWKEGVEFLLETGANVNIQNSKTGDTPLHHVVAGHWKEGVELLLEKGANVNIKNSKTRDTPLHSAAAGHWKEGIELLLAKGADRKIANAQGLLPRDIAAFSGKRISQLEPNPVYRIMQKILYGFGKKTNTGGSG